MNLEVESRKEGRKATMNGFFDQFPINHNVVCIEPVARIRAYNERDRGDIQRICCDTGFLGDPVDTVFADRELFSDLFTRPYLEHEPQWALVAEVDGRVIGYLLGSICKGFEWVLMRSGCQTACRMALRLASGRYAGHPRSSRFVRWLFTAGFREQPRHPAHAAHLHFNIDRGFRGRGICQRLWAVHESRLKEAGVQQCYGAFFSHAGRRPERVYRRYGFSVFDRKPTTIFQPEISGPVEVVCVHKNLGV